MGTPPSPTMITLGRLVRRYREAAGILQRDLARKLDYSEGWISQVETGRTRLRQEQVTAIERELDIPTGVLMDVHRQLDTEQIPGWFRPWLDEERVATVLRSFALALVPGLLQQEDYARALLQGDEAAVKARMERQAIFGRESPPSTHFVIDEAALYRGRGGPEVMHAQLIHLTEIASSPRLTIQVIRSSENPRSLGTFTLATVKGQEVAYVETAVRGLVTSSREDLAILSTAWESIRAFAMSQPDSIEFIRRTAEERWT
jgi:transcriptional regulator with XRE-family HTH domain